MFKKDKSGIGIVVTDRRWDAYGPDTPRSRFLKKLIDKQGGINESVEDGVYVFNATRKGLNLELTLTRVEE